MAGGAAPRPGEPLRKLLGGLGGDTGVYARVRTSLHGRGLGLETVTVVRPALLPTYFGWDCRRTLRSGRQARPGAEEGADIRTDMHPFP